MLIVQSNNFIFSIAMYGKYGGILFDIWYIYQSVIGMIQNLVKLNLHWTYLNNENVLNEDLEIDIALVSFAIFRLSAIYLSNIFNDQYYINNYT